MITILCLCTSPARRRLCAIAQEVQIGPVEGAQPAGLGVLLHQRFAARQPVSHGRRLGQGQGGVV